ncbi:ABC transporter permease [Neobacillus sp. OS1-32]|uniref:ABC transporter permease n=1 Tax=Neobacillus paridis TaxID=2803862 RepID=A0ABS1THK8_9BACI|nr:MULTISPECIES: ABC transporter permease [Neobacillus]MBL4950811.1 ABC transporter permease [Neobacillus paridis]WML31206.1 ABC transporter permease [Neobacillus sp. OS1-32]
MSQVQLDTDLPKGRVTAGRNLHLKKFGGECKRFIVTQKIGFVSLLVILLVILVAVFAPIIAPFDPVAQNREAILAAPEPQFFMGTDDLGRDVFSRIVYGSRISLLVGFATVVISIFLGILLGMVSGYFGGIVDMVIQRIMDAIMSIPALILALFIAALLGPAIQNVIIALTIIEVPRFARIVRGEMLRIRETNYVEASRSVGANAVRIIFKHGLPNMMAPIIVMSSLAFGQTIIAEASLSFLGIGTPPPNPSWGLMLSDASRYMESAPWLVLFPGLALSLLVLAFNLLGDALRDFLDPKMSA